MQDDGNLAELGGFCRRMGWKARQGEVGLLIGDEYFAIPDFGEEQTMKTQLDLDKTAQGLGAERRGTLTAPGGYLGAMQLLADIVARFRVPSGGGWIAAGPSGSSCRWHRVP